VPIPPKDKQSPASVYTPDYAAKAENGQSATVEALAAALKRLSADDRARLAALLVSEPDRVVE
jgi:hypothetical protein